MGHTAVTLIDYPELPAALTIEEHDLLQQCEQIIHQFRPWARGLSPEPPEGEGAGFVILQSTFQRKRNDFAFELVEEE